MPEVGNWTVSEELHEVIAATCLHAAEVFKQKVEQTPLPIECVAMAVSQVFVEAVIGDMAVVLAGELKKRGFK